MEKNSNVPKQCLDCRWFLKKSKIRDLYYDMNLPNRCFIFCLITKRINESYNRCKGISYEKR